MFLSPNPNCPTLFRPKLHTFPSFLNANPKFPPIAIFVYDFNIFTSFGTSALFKLPFPSSPFEL